MSKLKVIIAGSREFNDYDLLCEKVKEFVGGDFNPKQIEIVSGGAVGADKLEERFAEETGCDLKIMKAQWDKYGKAAGHVRNEEMAIYATNSVMNEGMCIVFWNGESAGSSDMIRLSRKYGLTKKVVFF